MYLVRTIPFKILQTPPPPTGILGDSFYQFYFFNGPVLGKPTGAVSDIVSYVITYEISYVITSEMALQRLFHT